MTLLHQAAQKAVEAVPRFRWDQDMDVLAGPYPDGEWVRRADVIAALQQQPEPVAEPPWWGAALNRRATVEQWMFDAARGKRPMPTPDELRAWAIKLGTPAEGERDMWVIASPLVAASPSTTRQQEVRSGWRLVPIEPTEEMKAKCTEGMSLGRSELWWQDFFLPAWRALLAAAPSTPENADGVPVVDSQTKPPADADGDKPE